MAITLAVLQVGMDAAGGIRSWQWPEPRTRPFA